MDFVPVSAGETRPIVFSALVGKILSLTRRTEEDVKKIMNPGVTVTWEGKQPRQKVIDAFLNSALAHDWSISVIDVVHAKLIDLDDTFRPEYSFDEAGKLIEVPIVDVGDWNDELYLLRCASKKIRFGENGASVAVEVMLQNLYLEKGYDRVDFYLSRRRPGVSTAEWVIPLHLHAEANQEIGDLLESFAEAVRRSEPVVS